VNLIPDVRKRRGLAYFNSLFAASSANSLQNLILHLTSVMSLTGSDNVHHLIRLLLRKIYHEFSSYSEHYFENQAHRNRCSEIRMGSFLQSGLELMTTRPTDEVLTNGTTEAGM